MNTLHLPAERRYAGGRTVVVAAEWTASRLSQMLHNSTYYGLHRLQSRHGVVEQQVPPLVSRACWEGTQQRLQHNRALSRGNAKRPYLLRGLITCEGCSFHYSGVTRANTARSRAFSYYRCNSQITSTPPRGADRCTAKLLAVDWLDTLVWRDCREFIRNPGEALAEAQRQLRAQLADSAHVEDERRALARVLASKDAERERVLTLFRRNRITLAEAESQLDAIAQEAATLRQTHDALDARAALASAFEGHVVQAASLLAQLRHQLEVLDTEADPARKRQIVELLVSRIAVRTEGTGHAKRAHLTIHYTFGQPCAVDSTMPRCISRATRPSRSRSAAWASTSGSTTRSGCTRRWGTGPRRRFIKSGRAQQPGSRERATTSRAVSSRTLTYSSVRAV
jgi:site-specific DNA recombinase